MFGYTNNIAVIDLTRKKTKVEALSKAFCTKFLGGNGFSIKLLYDIIEPRADPLSASNAIVFAVGPFIGTPIPTSGKYIVQSKSPLTNFQGEAVSSGVWGQKLKMAGYDGLVIKGKAKEPIYLFIDDEKVDMLSAEDLWGKDCYETTKIIRKNIGDNNIGVATIGPAGEHLTKFACIYNNGRTAGRTGMGAVLGSKQVKAIAVRGSKTITVAYPDKLLALCEELIDRCRNSLTTLTYRHVGTVGSFGVFHELGTLPIKNFQEGVLEEAELVRNDLSKYMTERYKSTAVACLSCPIACDHIFFIGDGPYKHTTVGVDFETAYAIGSNCGIRYFPAIAKANELCDKLGLDTISTGVVIGWAMECFERGILTPRDTDGIELSFGDYKTVIDLIPKIAYREGIGNLLAEGVKRASEITGKGSKHFAMHTKGLEFPGYDVRGLKATALSFAVSTRGACHLRARAYAPEIRGTIDRFKVNQGYGAFVAEQENILTLFDTLMLCKFSQGIWKEPFEEFAKLYSLVTGLPITPKEIRVVGERIYNMEKLFNLREGWIKSDDTLPPRIMKDPIPEGYAKGSHVKEEELDFLLEDYYFARGWTKDGRPTKQKLSELGLYDVSVEVAT